MSGYLFKCSPLPKPVYELLRKIAKDQDMTQRGVLVAGVLALVRLKSLDAAHAVDVLDEAKKLCPRREPQAAA